MDAVGSGRKQLYQGKEYDYVFDVDVQEGMPPLKLPYNANGMCDSQGPALYLMKVLENPYTAAQRFLESHDLPMTYLDQVVKFIEQNAGGVNLGGGGGQFVDPYTGVFDLNG